MRPNKNRPVPFYWSSSNNSCSASFFAGKIIFRNLQKRSKRCSKFLVILRNFFATHVYFIEIFMKYIHTCCRFWTLQTALKALTCHLIWSWADEQSWTSAAATNFKQSTSDSINVTHSQEDFCLWNTLTAPRSCEAVPLTNLPYLATHTTGVGRKQKVKGEANATASPTSMTDDRSLPDARTSELSHETTYITETAAVRMRPNTDPDTTTRPHNKSWDRKANGTGTHERLEQQLKRFCVDLVFPRLRLKNNKQRAIKAISFAKAESVCAGKFYPWNIPKFREGPNILTSNEKQYFCLDTASRSTKRQDMLEISGARPPWAPLGYGKNGTKYSLTGAKTLKISVQKRWSKVL